VVSRPGPVTWQVVDTAAPPFAVEDLNARILGSGDLAGKIVLLDFWATWCKPCLQELPELAVFAEQILDRDDVVFLSLNVTDKRSALQSFVQEHGIVYPVYSGDDLLDPYRWAFSITSAWRRKSFPGIVRFRHFGFTSLAAIDAKIEAMLAETTVLRR